MELLKTQLQRRGSGTATGRAGEPRFFRRAGVRGRLYIAFFGISLFVVIAAAVSLFSFLRVDKALDGITEESVPLAIASLDLSRQAERIVAAAPALLNTVTVNQQAQLAAGLNENVDRLNELLQELSEHTIEPQAITSIRRAVAQLRDTLNALNRVVTARLAISGQKRTQLLGARGGDRAQRHRRSLAQPCGRGDQGPALAGRRGGRRRPGAHAEPGAD